MEVKPGYPEANTCKMLSIIEKAKVDGADIVVFPEMAIPGYFLGDIWERNAFLKQCEAYGEKIKNASDGIVVVYGNVAVDWSRKNEDGRVRKYNACFVAEDKKFVVGDMYKYQLVQEGYNFVIKTLQPNYREFDDNRHFYDYRKFCRENDYESHMSFDPIELKSGLKISCILCEDGWDDDYAQSPMSGYDYWDNDLFINISCSPFTAGKNNKRNRVFSQKAQQYKTPMIYVNCVGVQDIGKTIYTFDGESCVYDKNGNMCKPYKPFEEAYESFYLWEDFPMSYWSQNETINPLDEDDIGKLYESIKYGTTKFMERMGINKVVIGASGGIDSALSAAIFSEILPKENITLVNMPNTYNSKTTKDLAKKLADNIGCDYRITDIWKSVDWTYQQVCMPEAPIESKFLTGFMQENVQARDRSSRVLAAWASLKGGVFTCNANKSEMTVGYTTMYGDLGGFLAPLADIWKTQVYEMAEWFNKNIKPIIPQGSIDIVPSAELSNKQDVDKNQGDPFDYKYHDLLFKSWVERWDRATPEDVLTWQMNGVLEDKLGWTLDEKIIDYVFNGDVRNFIGDLERWWSCYQGLGVAKRIQAPPVMAVSRRAFGFDHREAQIGVTYTEEYFKLKGKLLS